MTSVIKNVGWYVAAMEKISRSMGDSRTGEEDWSKPIPFTGFPLLAQLRGQ